MQSAGSQFSWWGFLLLSNPLNYSNPVETEIAESLEYR
jgi:hypothetical protein